MQQKKGIRSKEKRETKEEVGGKRNTKESFRKIGSRRNLNLTELLVSMVEVSVETRWSVP